jgi:hypothetical protein
MSIINDGIIYDPPKETIEFEVTYNGQVVKGTAKGSAMPINTYFDITLSGNTFSIDANYDNGYKWYANNGGTPMVELAPKIGKEIEKHFNMED